MTVPLSLSSGVFTPFFNEPEVLSDDSKEPEITEIIISFHVRQKKSTREDNLEGLPARIFNHTIVKAERPADVFRNSIAVPSLVSAVIAGKFGNHLPLERQSKCYKDNGVKLETNTLANWTMNSSEMYFSILYDELQRFL